MTDPLSYTITRDCPIGCLSPLLTRQTLDALIAGVAGHNDSPATVGHVIELYEQHQLLDIFNIGPGRAGEIRWALVEAGLIEANRVPLVKRWARDETGGNGHQQSCPRHK